MLRRVYSRDKPLSRACWFIKGIRPEAKINYTRDRFHGVGLLGIRSFSYTFCDKLNLVSAAEKFLASRSKLVILLDNAKWHKGRLVNELKERRRKTLRLVCFPVYSPELNPMESVVKESKKVLSNKVYENTEAMKKDLWKAYKKRSFFMHRMFKYLCP